MSIAFVCPECEARMEVPDEHAGLSGQCPRCQHVFTIPSSNAPPVRRATPVLPPPIPDAEPDTSRPLKNRRPRREPPAPQPRGPAWPWLVGLPTALVVAGLLFSSLMVLNFHRRPATPRLAIAAISTSPSSRDDLVSIGKLHGQRVHFDGGAFTLKTLLTPTDPTDNPPNGSRAKRFLLELQPGKLYQIEMESTRFNPFIELKDSAGFVMRNAGNFGNNKAQFDFEPRDPGVFTLRASSMDPRVGLFSLKITERVPGPR